MFRKIKATRRKLGGLGIVRCHIPLFVWVTSLTPCECEHIPHHGTKMWQNNPETAWADLPFFLPTFRNNPPHGTHAGVATSAFCACNQDTKKFSLASHLPSICMADISGNKRKSLPLYLNPQKLVQLGEGKTVLSRTSLLSYILLCSKIVHMQLFLCAVLHSLNSRDISLVHSFYL